MIILIAGAGFELGIVEEIMAMKHDSNAVVIVDSIPEDDAFQKLIESHVLELKMIERDLMEYCDYEYLKKDYASDYKPEVNNENITTTIKVATHVNPNCPNKASPT